MMGKDYLTVTEAEVCHCFPKLPDRTNKGNMGRLLLVCGSYDLTDLSMCGAAYFAAMAAYRTGAGIVEIFTARENYSPLVSLVPEAIFSLYGADDDREELSDRLIKAVKRSDAVVIGCGLGKSLLAKEILKTVLGCADCPLLVDADGLNIMSENEGLWSLLSSEQRKRTVITPHPGEMSRLCGKPVAEILTDIQKTACDFALEKGILCLLKDHNTAISDGKDTYVNLSGNPGMATAGMGDLLAGIIGALFARDIACGNVMEPLTLAAVGAYVHGRAGDLALEKSGEYSLVARDLLSEIPTAIR